MGHVRRIVLFAFICLALLTPFLATAWVLMRSPPACVPPIATAGMADWPTAQWLPTAKPAVEATKNHPTAPLQAAGTQDSLWVLIPAQSTDGKTDYYKLWAHAAGDKVNGQDAWVAVKNAAGGIMPGLPSQLAVQVPPFAEGMPSSAVVFFDSPDSSAAGVMGYSPTDDRELPFLPQHQQPIAVVGGGDRGDRILMALTRGPHPTSTTQTGTQPAIEKTPTASAPAITPAIVPATAPATSPTTTATMSSDQWNLFQASGAKWSALSTFSPGGDYPSLDAHIVLALQQDQLWLLWYEPAHPEILKVKSFVWRAATAHERWLPTIVQTMYEPMTRLQVVTVPMVLLWPVMQNANDTAALHGVSLSPEGKVDMDKAGAVRRLTLDLGEAGKGVAPERDIAAAQLGNSIAVIVAGKDGTLRQLLFASDGRPNGEAVKIDPSQNSSKPSANLEYARLVILMLLMALSLWFWRKQPALMALPKGVQVAALGQRIAASLIDLSLPLVAVVLGFGLYDTEKLSLAWQRGEKAYFLVSPLQAMELIWFVAIYLLHVTISEMVAGRSLGKVVFGLKVINIRGGKALPRQILLRNILRVAELMVPPVLIMPVLIVPVITPLRQRLGDIIARTLVVQMHSLPPEELPVEKEDEATAGRK